MEQVVFDSEESTSSESGWTLYLQHDHQYSNDDHFSSSWKKPISLADRDDQEEDDGDDDDDMSMVSDASSGPPHFQEHQEQDDDDDDDDDEYSNNDDDDHHHGHVFCHHPSTKRRKILKQTSFHSHIQLQDQDTASSSFFTTKDLNVCDKEDDNSFDYSQGHSTTYFEMV